MTIQLIGKGQTINGVAYAAWSIISGLDPEKEAAAIQGGGAVLVNGGVVLGGAAGPANTAPVLVATFGDSTANTGSSYFDNAVFSAPFPASGATSYVPNVDKWALSMTYPPAYLVGNFGISGETTAQMIARSALASSTTRKAIEDVASVKPDVVIFRGGSINDLFSVTAATKAATIAATYARHIKILAGLRTAAGVVIDQGVYGYSGTGAVDAAVTRQCVVELNAMYKAYAATQPGVYWMGTLGIVSDEFGAYVSGMANAADGVHLNNAGQYAMSLVEAALLTKIFGAWGGGPRYKGANLIDNAAFTQVSNQSYGEVPTGFSVVTANATRQNAKIEVIDGKSWMTCEFVPTGASPMGTINIPYSPQSYGFSATDTVGAEIDIMIESLDGQAFPSPTTLNVRLDTTKTAAGRIALDGTSTGYPQVFVNGAWRSRVCFTPWKVGEASASLAQGAWFFTVSPTTSTRGFKMGISSPRFVKIA